MVSMFQIRKHKLSPNGRIGKMKMNFFRVTPEVESGSDYCREERKRGKTVMAN